MKFSSLVVQAAATKPSSDPKDVPAKATVGPWQKARRGKTFLKAKPIALPNTHYIRVVIPQEATLSTEKQFMDNSFNILAKLIGHLESLDDSIVLHERNEWLEGSPPSARTITIPLSLKEALKNGHLSEPILTQFNEIYTEAKRGGLLISIFA
jgi:hypothetical protein